MNVLGRLAVAAVPFCYSLFVSLVFTMTLVVIIGVNIHSFRRNPICPLPTRLIRRLQLTDIPRRIIMYTTLCLIARVRPLNLLRLRYLQLHLLYLVHMLNLPLA